MWEGKIPPQYQEISFFVIVNFFLKKLDLGRKNFFSAMVVRKFSLDDIFSDQVL